MRLMYNEKLDVENLLVNGFTDGFRFSELVTIAKYYRHVVKRGDAKIRTYLRDYCIRFDNSFRIDSDWGRLLTKKAIKLSNNDFKNTTAPIYISKKELESLEVLKSYKAQLIMLVMLVIAKLNKREVVWMSEWKLIRKIISRRITSAIIKKYITFVYEKKLLGEQGISDLHQLLFLDKNAKDSFIFCLRSDADIYMLPEMYKAYKGGEIIYCTSCGKEIEKTSNSRKYCNNCQKEKRKLDVRKNVKDYRKKLM